jgi:hypothetical protein
MDEVMAGGGPVMDALARWRSPGVSSESLLDKMRHVLDSARTMEEFACGASLIFAR